MTAKQKAARERFKKVQAEAKKLRKKNPKLSQADAVKKAWAISYSAKKKSKKVIGTTKKDSSHKDTKSHNVNIRVVSGVFSKDELNFLEKEGKESKGYSYRAKILFGSPIVLKETKNGTPIKKFYVDDYDKAVLISKELNSGKSLAKVKGKKIV